MNAPQVLRIILLCIKSVERDRLVGHDARRFVNGMGINPMILHVAFGACDEESAGLIKRIQSSKIDITPIHDINGASLRSNKIQGQRISHFTIGNMDKTGDWTTQVKKRMHLDGSFCRSKIGPWKQ